MSRRRSLEACVQNQECCDGQAVERPSSSSLHAAHVVLHTWAPGIVQYTWGFTTHLALICPFPLHYICLKLFRSFPLNIDSLPKSSMSANRTYEPFCPSEVSDPSMMQHQWQEYSLPANMWFLTLKMIDRPVWSTTRKRAMESAALLKGSHPYYHSPSSRHFHGSIGAICPCCRQMDSQITFIPSMTHSENHASDHDIHA